MVGKANFVRRGGYEPVWEDKAYKLVEEMVPEADGYHENSPWWYGYALRKAYLRGVEDALKHQEPARE